MMEKQVVHYSTVLHWIQTHSKMTNSMPVGIIIRNTADTIQSTSSIINSIITTNLYTSRIHYQLRVLRYHLLLPWLQIGIFYCKRLIYSFCAYNNSWFVGSQASSPPSIFFRAAVVVCRVRNILNRIGVLRASVLHLYKTLRNVRMPMEIQTLWLNFSHFWTFKNLNA